MKILEYNHTKLYLFDNGSFSISRAEDTYLEQKRVSGQPNFEVNINGGKPLFLNEDGFVFTKMEEQERHVYLTYVCEKKSLQVQVELDFSKGSDVVAQKNTITNLGEKTVKLTRFSSAFLDDIGIHDAEKMWYQNDGIKIYICHNKWQGEGQWKAYTPAELGIYPATTHGWERESFRISSVGSWSTANYYPLVLVEEEETKQCWFMELEGSHSWMMKLAAYGGYNEGRLTLEATGCEEGNGNWFYDLAPGESYQTERAFYGVVSGGLEAAAAALYSFKRADSVIKSDRHTIPLVFNDYMDCIWGHQKPELILPLIEKAAKVGCEVFCIDGGWCENENGAGLGDWLPKQSHYKDISLQAVLDKIKECGMVPGIWFEWEACEKTAKGYQLDNDWILLRHGEPVGEARAFYNFRNPQVRAYLKEKVRSVYEMGVRYIKNDYNQSLCVGCTNHNPDGSPAEGIRENAEAFYGFVEDLYQEFPDLMIENCCSGALRSDHKTLRHFALQSSSDQELYENNPSILMGSLLQYPPEKAGVWSYPYPAMIDEAADFKLTDEYIARMANGRQTAFNMITAMMGVLYQSGRIDLCDEKNEALIQEAITLYKENRALIGKSRPIYPLGLHNINDKELTALGLLSEQTLQLAVWNLAEQTNALELDLKKWIPAGAKLEVVYPAEKAGVVLEEGVLKTTLEEREAVYVRVNCAI